MSRYYSADILGSIEDTTNASGTSRVNHQEYDAFGNLFSSSGPTPSPFQYCGRQGYQTDNDGGLQLLGNRYYDPALGRFLSRDPAKAGDNWYAYAGNNPVSNSDPSGLKQDFFIVHGLAPTTKNAGNPIGELEDFVGTVQLTASEDFWTYREPRFAAQSYQKDVAAIKANTEWTKDQQQKEIDNLGKIYNDPVGNLLLAFQNILSVNIVFHEYAHDTDGTLNARGGREGQNGFVLIDPRLNVEIHTVSGAGLMQPYEVLEHELGHAITGLPDNANIFQIENPFRISQGLSPRIDHKGIGYLDN